MSSFYAGTSLCTSEDVAGIQPPSQPLINTDRHCAVVVAVPWIRGSVWVGKGGVGRLRGVNVVWKWDGRLMQ